MQVDDYSVIRPSKRHGSRNSHNWRMTKMNVVVCCPKRHVNDPFSRENTVCCGLNKQLNVGLPRDSNWSVLATSGGVVA